MAQKALGLIPGLIIQWLIVILFPIAIPFAWITTYILYRREVGKVRKKSLNFHKNRPFFPFGIPITDYEFSFDSAAQHVTSLQSFVETFSQTYPGTAVEKLTISDTGANPTYTKLFVRVSSRTHLRTEISFISNVEAVANTLFIRWWVLMRGTIKRGRVFRFVLFSPIFSFAFWIIPWIRREYSIVGKLGGNIEHTYDTLDITAWVAAFQKSIFDATLTYLETLKVNVDDYREKPSGLNVINVQGSGNIIGAVSQGSSSYAAGMVQQN